MSRGMHKMMALVLGWLWITGAQSGTDELMLSGYVKSYALWQDAVEPLTDEQWQSQNSGRLMLQYFTGSQFSAELHYEVQPIYRSHPATPTLEGSPFSTLATLENRYRVKDINNDYGDGEENWILLHNLDRLNVRLALEQGDLTVGRQVVSFGSARFINPTDIFLPFGLQTLNQEYRVGIDAVRYQAALGDFGQLDMGWVIGEDAKRENSALFLRGRQNWNGRDVQAVAIVQDQAWLLGGGVETALGDVGFWLETAYVSADRPMEESVAYWRHSVGSDFALNERWVLMLEYHFNGAGADDPADYGSLLAFQPYQKGGVYLLGQHYLIPALSWQASPLVTVSASGFFNLQDDSRFLSVAADISWSEDLYSDVRVYLSDGAGLKFDDGLPPTLQFGSEFGTYPVSVYASLRWYF